MKFQQPTQQSAQRPEQAAPAGTAATGTDPSALRTMNYREGAAAVSPFTSRGPGEGAPVQLKLVPGATVEAMDAATVDDMLEAIRPTRSWQDIVAFYKKSTANGTKPLEPGGRDEVVLDLLIALEDAFKFGGGLSIDTLWDDAALVDRMVRRVEKAAAPADKPETPAEPEPEAVVLPAPGTFGMVTEDTPLLAEDGSEVPLSEGDAVEALRGHAGKLVVKVHSGAAGKVGSIDPEVFKAQPRLSVNEDTGETENYSFQQYVGELFLARKGIEEPSVQDVDQGALGDCYLIAAMGAVVASNPDVIHDMVEYDASTGQYTVTFQELQRNGKFKPHKETVDAYLPTRRGGHRTAYALSDTSFNPDDQALWPAIIEKAYAQWQGGYQELDKGGSGARAMQLFTGVRSVRAAMPAEDDVVAMFQGWQSGKKAVVCGTRDWIDQRSVTGLIEGEGDGPYRGTLTDRDGAGAEIVKNTVKIRDADGGSGRITDDGKGALKGSGLDHGTIGYEDGTVRFDYAKDKGPAGGGASLEATYRYEGLLSSALNVHADHAYIFREVKDGLLYFHNPWGPAAHKHPKPMTGAQFRDLYETIGVNATIPQQEG